MPDWVLGSLEPEVVLFMLSSEGKELQGSVRDTGRRGRRKNGVQRLENQRQPLWH